MALSRASLGDRHGENILLDCVNGDCVHVDLNCILEKVRRDGATLFLFYIFSTPLGCGGH